MFQVSETTQTNHEVKKSLFTSYLLPFTLFEETLKILQKEHPKANHIVWAYRYFNEFDQIVENSTDNGEPKGCAGNPTLSQLRGAKLINTALITIRYFGGIKLGTGGMVRAYSEAALQVIQETQLIPYRKQNDYTFETPYTLLKRYEHYLNLEKIPYPTREFGIHTVTWRLKMTKEEFTRFKSFQESL